MLITTIERNLAADLLQMQLLEAAPTRIGSYISAFRRSEWKDKWWPVPIERARPAQFAATMVAE